MTLALPSGPVRDQVRWRGLFVVRKYWADDDLARATPYEVIEAENLVLTAGATAVWNRLAGLGSVTAFDGTNGRLCVGDSTVAANIAQTDLQASTNKYRKVFDAAPTISTNSFTAVATFLTTEANFPWNEAGVANAASGGVLLNRVVQSFGTKTSSVQWVLTAALTLQGA